MLTKTAFPVAAGAVIAHTHPTSEITGLATVATSGSYADLGGTPSLGTSASRNVGTAAGTVAAGDDSRFDVSAKANLSSPTFTGTPSAPTATAGTNTTQLATCAFVQTAVAAAGSGAPLASPAFTGNPTAPTPTAGDNDTSIATTAFVQGEIASKAPIASPTFTGTPAAPTAGAGTNTTQLATTAFVTTAVAAGAAPTTHLAIGTYVMAAYNVAAGALATGATTASSNLKLAYFFVNSSNVTEVAQAGSAIASGTWRNMGMALPVNGGGTDPGYRISLFVRVS